MFQTTNQILYPMNYIPNQSDSAPTPICSASNDFEVAAQLPGRRRGQRFSLGVCWDSRHWINTWISTVDTVFLQTQLIGPFRPFRPFQSPVFWGMHYVTAKLIYDCSYVRNQNLQFWGTPTSAQTHFGQHPIVSHVICRFLLECMTGLHT